MIILHNPYDKDSRDFVSKYGEGNTVIPYPECLTTYNEVSKFPSIVINVPAYYIPQTTLADSTTLIGDINVDAHIELFCLYSDEYSSEILLEKYNEYLEMVEKRSQDNPPKNS